MVYAFMCLATANPGMNQTQKIIRPKLGVLELAKQLGNVSQACKIFTTLVTPGAWFKLG